MSLGSKDPIMRGHIGWRDPVSIRRGNEIISEARRSNPRCVKDLHDMTPENTKIKKRREKEYRECIACAKIAYDGRKMGPRQEPLCP